MKSLAQADVNGKRVLVRADFNVEIGEDGKILDDFRIRAVLPTLNHLFEQKARIILMAHLGRPKPEEKEKFSLRPIAARLSQLLGREIPLAPDCVGPEIIEMVSKLGDGEILMLENLRWHKEEEDNDEDFAKSLAGLGELYVNDAFAVSHRDDASLDVITRFLPSYPGFLMEKEISILSRLRDNPDHPLCVIIGGAKISDKIDLIQSFFGKAEDIILGGALANTVLHAKGIAVGKSMVEENMGEEVKKLEINTGKIHLPVDTMLCTTKDGTGLCRTGAVGKIGDDELILDIGPDSIELFKSVISEAKMIVWNGPIGYFEVDQFSHGSKAIAEAIASSSAFSIIGGGETVAFIDRLGMFDRFSFVSTGGGAMMDFLAGNKLPGIEALK